MSLSANACRSGLVTILSPPFYHMEQNLTQPNFYADPILRQPAAPMSVTDWLITMLITFIPLVGFIMLFVWAFGSDTNPSKATWAKANLIFMVIAIGLAALFAGSLLTYISQNGGMR
jgi:hypothetical protein